MKYLALIFISYFVYSVAGIPPKYDLDQISNVWDLVAGNEEEFERELINEQDALSRSPEVLNRTAKIIEKHGYTYEEHEITTPDGYLLTVYRITGGPVTGPSQGKKVAFLMHGVVSSSADWVVSGPGKALAYILCDSGYDVWMGNARGNTHSRKHLYLSPNKRQFWDFSWHEIGQIDLPAMIDYALQVSGQTKLHYIGHSQGTTTFFVMGALRSEMMPKIMSMHALAPVGFMKNSKSPFIKALAPFVTSVDVRKLWINFSKRTFYNSFFFF